MGFRTTRFDTEEKGTSKMANYVSATCVSLQHKFR